MSSIINKTLEINALTNVMTRKSAVIERRYCKMVFGKGLVPQFHVYEIGIYKNDDLLRKEYGYDKK